MDFGEKIKRLRLNQGMTLEEVCQQVGVGKSTVRKWESGEIANMRRDKIAVLANALHVSPAYLMGWEDSPEKESPALPAGLLPIQRRKIPLLGSVAAGEPILADREYDAYISVDGDHRADAALRVDGDSFNKKIPPSGGNRTRESSKHKHDPGHCYAYYSTGGAIWQV